MSATIYEKQVQLLLKILHIVNKFDDFAVKGGTAINFFVQNMPRLSIDIDLTYLPIKIRKASIEAINSGMKELCLEIKRYNPTYVTMPLVSKDKKMIKHVIISYEFINIKIF